MSKRIALELVFLLGWSIPALWGANLQQANQALRTLGLEVREAAGERQPRKWSGKEYYQRLASIGAMVNSALVSEVNRCPGDSGKTIEQELRRALSLDGSKADLASAFAVRLEAQKIYVIAYALSAMATLSRSWVGVLGSEGLDEPYGILASVHDSLPNKTVALVPLPPGTQGQLRFLSYGVNWGDPHKHLTVIAYSFKGHHLKRLWSRSQLPGGQVKVHGDRIGLCFLNMALGPGYRGVHWVKQVYRVIPAGVRLEGTVTGPNSTGVKPPAGTKRVGP